MCIAHTVLSQMPFFYRFPSDPRLVPAVGNGRVATQVLSDTIYVNNVYNGFGNNSHRARWIHKTIGRYFLVVNVHLLLYVLEVWKINTCLSPL